MVAVTSSNVAGHSMLVKDSTYRLVYSLYQVQEFKNMQYDRS